MPGVVHSASAKAGVLAMTRTLAVEWARFGDPRQRHRAGPVRVRGRGRATCGPSEGMRRRRSCEQNPLGRFGRPRTRSPAHCLYLLSPACEYVNGECFVVDGGALARAQPVVARRAPARGRRRATRRGSRDGATVLRERRARRAPDRATRIRPAASFDLLTAEQAVRRDAGRRPRDPRRPGAREARDRAGDRARRRAPGARRAALLRRRGHERAPGDARRGRVPADLPAARRERAGDRRRRRGGLDRRRRGRRGRRRGGARRARRARPGRGATSSSASPPAARRPSCTARWPTRARRARRAVFLACVPLEQVARRRRRLDPRRHRARGARRQHAPQGRHGDEARAQHGHDGRLRAPRQGPRQPDGRPGDRREPEAPRARPAPGGRSSPASTLTARGGAARGGRWGGQDGAW